MKLNYITTLFLACLVFASSCKDADEPESPILGTWDYVSVSYTECDNPGHDFFFDYPQVHTITYNSDGTFETETASGGNYKITGSNVTTCFSGQENNCETASFIINDSTMIQTSGHELFPGCVVTLILTKE